MHALSFSRALRRTHVKGSAHSIALRPQGSLSSFCAIDYLLRFAALETVFEMCSAWGIIARARLFRGCTTRCFALLWPSYGFVPRATPESTNSYDCIMFKIGYRPLEGASENKRQLELRKFVNTVNVVVRFTDNIAYL